MTRRTADPAGTPPTSATDRRAAHTPGPWAVRESWVWAGEFGQIVAHTGGLPHQLADARLIADAPALLDRLVGIRAAFDANDSHGIREEIEASRAAVARHAVTG